MGLGQWHPGLLKPCGTPAAARRHQRRGEPLCETCRQAARREKAGRIGVMPGTDSPDYREVRNGLPEFRPYVYRGTGTDAYTGEVG